MPLLTESTLSRFTNKQLQVLVRKYNITRIPRLQADKVAKLVEVSEMRNQCLSEVERMELDLQEKWNSGPAPAHDFYKAHFNFDDLVNRKWYAVEETHPNLSWKSKMILALMCFMVYDVWVHSTRSVCKRW